MARLDALELIEAVRTCSDFSNSIRGLIFGQSTLSTVACYEHGLQSLVQECTLHTQNFFCRHIVQMSMAGRWAWVVTSGVSYIASILLGDSA